MARDVDRYLGRARLVTGLVLFAYVLTHNLNHALGIASLEAMEAGRLVFLAFWRFPPVELALFAALVIHVGIALRALYQRRQLKMPFWEGAQLVLGLATPPMLLTHVVATAYAHDRFQFIDSYAYELAVLWAFKPLYGWLQAAAVLVTWVHGCIGLAYWLRLKPSYPMVRPYLFALAIIIPVLALVGFIDGGRTVMDLLERPEWLAAIKASENWPGAEAAAVVFGIQDRGLALMAGVLLLVLLARLVRAQLGRRRAILITYEAGDTVRIQAGTSVLEASRLAGIPHASVCGGRGRCSTCRIKILKGGASLPPAADEEKRVLARVGAAPDTRLACQLRPNAAVTVAPLLPAHADPRHAHARGDYHSGREIEIAVLFADLRGFTRISERRLPYDVVFLLNRYFRAMGEAVTQAGGHIDKFIGDGVMALFGIRSGDGDGAEACRQALDAARRMSANLAELNRSFAAELSTPLRIGIGIHFGSAIVGDMGFGASQHLTAIGDTVNTASRLEAATKELDCQLVISEQVRRAAGLGTECGARHALMVRGREQTLDVFAIGEAQDMVLAGRDAGGKESR